MSATRVSGVYYIGIYKLTPSFTYTPKPCEESVLTLSCRKRLLGSGEVHPDFTPKFEMPKDQYENDYLSYFGPGFALPYNYPGAGPDECRTAIGRMIALREPTKPWVNGRLIRNQERFRRKFRVTLLRYKAWFESNMDRSPYEEAYPEWLFKPNAKRRMRIEREELNQITGHDYEDDHKNVQFKPKKGELLPDGKKRGVGDLGSVRTSATAWCFDSIKAAMEGRENFKTGNYEYEFVKSPDKGKLVDVFKNLVNPASGKAYYVYFSDDCCVSAYCSDGVVFFNGDIKQCDGSHYTAMLKMVEDFLSTTRGVENVHSSAIRRAYAYLKKDLTFRNPAKRSKQKVKYSFTTSRMYSGFAGTTVTNNFANMMIGIALESIAPDPSVMTKAEFVLAYTRAAALAGYLVKAQLCEKPEDLQFLKHSIAIVDGEYIPYMGLGVEVRGYATFKGDLPGRGSYIKRVETFLSDVAISRSNWGLHALREAMDTRIIKDEDRVQMTGAVYASTLTDMSSKSIGVSGVYIPTSALLVRYHMTEADFTDLCDQIRSAQIGDIVFSDAAIALYNKDYG